MFNRPRCRDWSPLATQQLRLRNLIQITGHNIVVEAKTPIYFTLHLTLMSAPFFTSERLESFKNAIWAEINCQSINKSTSQFVYVRVWQSSQPRMDDTLLVDEKNSRRISMTSTPNCSSIINYRDRDVSLNNDVLNIDRRESSGSSSHTSCSDKVLFVWGVYFSGLVPISKRSKIKLKDNALVFYIHGGFFTSAEYLLAESIGKQYDYFYRTDQRSCLLNNSSTSKYTNNVTAIKGASNCINPTKNCDSFNSNRNVFIAPNATDRKSDFFSPILKSTSSSISGSPKRSEIEYSGRLSPSCDVIANIHNRIGYSENMCTLTNDGTNEFMDPNKLKIRYLDKEFYKLEIRPSYNVKKLQALQEKQRIFRKRTINANEVMEKICMKSAFCLNLTLIANKGMLYRPRGNPSIGRTLNRLLATQPEQPKPEVLLKAQELRRKIETAKFRCRFLAMERDRYKVNLRKLQDKCTKLSDENIEKESWLMANYRGLGRDRDMAIEQKSMFLRQQKLYENVIEMLAHRQRQLLGQLKDIYPIEECHAEVIRVYKINGIYLPNTDALRMYGGTGPLGAISTPSSLCVALGYVSHIVLLCSSILNIPLRNKITYRGSASKIRDDIKMLSEQDRDFPLFCRHIPPTDSLLYAVFLLNQNISQIKFMLNIHSAREDIRATLRNLLDILTVTETSMQQVLQDTISASHFVVDGNELPMSSVSETSIDVMIPVPVKKNHSTSDENINAAIRPKIGLSKSRGSFSDEHLMVRNDKMKHLKVATSSNSRHIFSSEPILSTGQLFQTSTFKN